MKKIMKLSKILLLIMTVLSYLSSPISVLAEEIINSGLKPLVLNLDANSEEGYTLTYISANPSDYENTKDYKIELETTVTYTNGDEEVLKNEEFSVSGQVLNNVRSSYEIDDPVLELYNGEYVLEVRVYDDTTLVYSEECEYENDYRAPVGLTGKLNELVNGEVSPVKEVVGETTVGNYDVTEGVYTQKLGVLLGDLSPKAMYRVVFEGEDVTYSEVVSASELALMVLDGTSTDLTGKLAGEYSYTDSVTIEEVGTTDSGLEVLNKYVYTYNANLKNGTDNDDLFTNMYEVIFVDGYMGVPAKGLGDTDTVITLEELITPLENTEITLEVLDETGKVIYSVTEGEEDVLAGEIKNGYVLRFTNGATASYEVVVVGDNNSDNEFSHEDLVGVIEGYINEEKMPSMDMVSSNEDTEGSEEVGTITFEDVIVVNELLRENANLDREEVVNENLGLVFGDAPVEVFVSDTFELQVLLNKNIVGELSLDDAEEVLEYINGIDGTVLTSDNLVLSDVKFNEELTGSYNEDGRVVAVGNDLYEDNVVMTLVFEVVGLGDGTASVVFGGNTSKYLTITEFEELSQEFVVTRRISTNNNLGELNASIGTFDIEFNSDETIYTLTVPHNTESVVLDGLVEDEYAEVTGLGEYELTDNSTTAIITVTAEDGTSKVYTVYIVKDTPPVTKPVVYYYSSNNYLKALEVKGYEIEFDKYTNEYKITVKNDVDSLDITALAEDSRARVEITGNGNFKEGKNTVTVTVTAENGSVNEYKLVVEKEARKAVTDLDNSSNNAEKIVIIVLIILVVLGLLYLIFKKDEEDEAVVKKEDNNNNKNNNKENNNRSDNKNNNKNNKNKKKR